MKATEYCAAHLRERGVRRVYGIPGPQSLDLIEAFRRSGIRFVLAHHEAAAGYMATVESQLTGVPGVCLVNQGSGTANVAAAVSNAELDRSPLVVMAGIKGPDSGTTVQREMLPLLSAYELTAKWAAELTAANLRQFLPWAFELAAAPRCGPVFLTISTSEGQKEVDDSPVPVQAPLPSTDEGSAISVKMATARLRGFRRPVLVAGTGVLESQASAPLLQLAERLRAPVTVTLRAKGQFPEDHPLFLGTLGVRADGPIRDLLAGADVALLIGLDGIELDRPPELEGTTISIAFLGTEDPTFRPDLSIEGDLYSNLEALAEVSGVNSTWDERQLRACREAVRRELAPRTGRGLAPQTVARLLREEMPRNTILACDRGAHRSTFCQAWSSFEPGSLLVTMGLSAMGFALPAAIAAKLVSPDRPVVAVTGDSGLLTYAAELWSLVRMGLPVLVVVMADGGLTSIRMRQRDKGYPNVGVDFGNPDYAAIARGFRLEAVRVGDAALYLSALRHASRSDVPYLIHADVNPEEYR